MASGTKPVALVTGARRGMGAATCIALAGAGYDIIAIDKELEGARETGHAVVAAGGDFDFRFCDLADPEAVAWISELAWEIGGGVEAVVNNAGVGTLLRGDPLALAPESWERALAVNTRAPFFLTQSLARRMVAADAPRRGPRGIVFVTSVNAALASPDRADYCASKAALSMVARCFALRLAEDGIPVFEVRPGVIRTAMTEPVASATRSASPRAFPPSAAGARPRTWRGPSRACSRAPSLSPPATPSMSMAGCISAGFRLSSGLMLRVGGARNALRFLPCPTPLRPCSNACWSSMSPRRI